MQETTFVAYGGDVLRKRLLLSAAIAATLLVDFSVALAQVPATRPSLISIKHARDTRYLTQAPRVTDDGQTVTIGVVGEGPSTSELRVYNVETGQLIYRAAGPIDGTFWLAAISSNGKHATVIRLKPRQQPLAADTSLIELVDLSKGLVSHTFEAQPALKIGSVHFNHDGTLVIFPPKEVKGGPRRTAGTYAAVDTTSGKTRSVYTLGDFDSPETFASDGRSLVSWYGAILDANTGALAATLKMPSAFQSTRKSFVAGESRLVAVDPQYRFITFDSRDGAIVRQTEPLERSARQVACEFTPSGKRLIINNGYSLQMIDVEKAQSVGSWSPPLRDGERIAALSPRAQTILIQSDSPDELILSVMKVPSEDKFVAIRPKPSTP